MSSQLSRLLTFFEGHPMLEKGTAVLLLALVAWIAGLVARWVLTRLVRRVVKRTGFTWDDALLEHGVFSRLSRVVPAAVLYYGAGALDVWVGDPSAATGFDYVIVLVRSAAAAFVVLMIVMALSSLLSALSDVYAKRPEAQARSIKGYVQLAQIGLFVFGAILVLATLMNRSPAVLLGSAGALMAVAMVVFKDTILSLVASLQLNSNDMIRVGDWVEMPSQGVDGDIIDIALHTVKVKNFDNTVTTVPTYSFITEAFKNWRAMHESTGRRVKRPIFFDMSSIRFLSEEETRNFRRFGLLEAYVEAKRGELDTFNAAIPDGVCNPQARRLTNIGTFRAYARHYLENHPQVHRDLRILVRQLDPSPEGLPIQFYFFTNTTDWGEYEDIQSDIFDHFLAIAAEFGLRPFQHPTGQDMQRLAGGGESPAVP